MTSFTTERSFSNEQAHQVAGGSRGSLAGIAYAEI
jgi:hypothetical protein